MASKRASKRPLLSVVTPCYNEEKNIRLGVLTKVSAYLDSCVFTWEVIVVDDGSDDQTVELVEQFLTEHSGWSLIKNSHQGKARAVVAGIKKAKGKYILFTDFDQATPLVEFEKFLPLLKKRWEIVIGSRNSKREGAPFLRSLMARGFSFIRSKLIGLENIRDTQCGFKAFEAKAAKKLVKKLKLYGNTREAKGSSVTAGFDVELLFIARKLGFKIKEVCVDWHYVETRRVNPLIDSWHGLMDIFKIKLLDLQGKYR